MDGCVPVPASINFKKCITLVIFTHLRSMILISGKPCDKSVLW
jgi:hypothetical protein